ncbi:MAG TPA: bifunctional DNA primase/polymerase [Streptosporangiaceae bacterium]|nr:bifunctional DNA primase/polymerase [Streptosporangiaceae bacterium]
MYAAADATLRRALEYALRRWPVFPCQPDGKQPATRHGFRDASTDPGQIRRWWSRQAQANLAIATGSLGPDVLDVDQHDEGNGFAAWRRLTAAGLLDGTIAIVATPGGGLHAYFSGTAQPSRRLPSHHLDFKAVGGYVLALPSRVGGKSYRLLSKSGAAGAILDWAAVYNLLEPRRGQVASEWSAAPTDGARLASWVGRLDEGNRNSGLFWAACRAIEADQEHLLDGLAAAAATTGLTDREIKRTIASARRSTQPNQTTPSRPG